MRLPLIFSSVVSITKEIKLQDFDLIFSDFVLVFMKFIENLPVVDTLHVFLGPLKIGEYKFFFQRLREMSE